MFTGLVQEVGTLRDRSSRADGANLSISTNMKNLVLGESIAVDGACLSVTGFMSSGFEAFASEETLGRTGLGSAPVGDRVNLERALKLGDAMGGHLVTGHVDTRVKLLEKTPMGKAIKLTLALPTDDSLKSQVAPKGSVALGGISLTVNDVNETSFNVMVIPLTLEHTTLDNLYPGAEINLETDVLAKYVAMQLNRGSSHGSSDNVNMDLLVRSGFIK